MLRVALDRNEETSIVDQGDEQHNRSVVPVTDKSPSLSELGGQ